MPLIGAPSLRVEAGDAQGLQQRRQARTDVILTPDAYRGEDFPRMGIAGMPEPARVGFLAHLGPHVVELCAQPTASFQLVRTAYLHLHMRGMPRGSHGMVHRV